MLLSFVKTTKKFKYFIGKSYMRTIEILQKNVIMEHIVVGDAKSGF